MAARDSATTMLPTASDAHMLGFSDMQNHKDYHKHIYKITNIVKNLRKILEIEYLEETDH